MVHSGWNTVKGYNFCPKWYNYKRVRGWTMGHGTETPQPLPHIKYYSNLGAALISRQSQRPCGCLLISGGRYKMQVTGQITSAG